MRNLDEVDACLKEHLTVPNFRGIRLVSLDSGDYLSVIS